MVSGKIFALLWVVCLVARAQANGDTCQQEIKNFADDLDQKMARMQQQIQSMTPVLKDFMWHTFELEHQVRNMRERLARFEKASEPSQPVVEATTAAPVRKAVDQNAGNIFIRPGQTTIGVIGGKLSSLLTETNNNNDLGNGASS